MKRRRLLATSVLAAWLAGAACSGDDSSADGPGPGGSGGQAGESGDAGQDQSLDVALDQTDADASLDAPSDEGEAEASSPCPADMVLVDDFCIDRYEAPGVAGALPLVMYTFVESEAWCGARGKRLCFDDEWTRSCEGTGKSKYPYGDAHVPGQCNDEETWKLYDQSQLNGWPWTVSKPAIESLTQLLDAARAASAGAKIAADHVEWLYQAEPAGSNTGCVGPDGVFDLEGNVEEWTRRRDGGTTDFSGSLKGRYWAEPRTCQNAVTNHGNGFRFYEIGFRCCKDVPG
ncbi:MAG: SUMF1/EgtB/PvdO family nonheme iron enzyme [Polyangiaceae bacterium]